jgi:hypothetical protein
MEHNYDNDVDFLAKKEWLINFIDNFEINTDMRFAQSLGGRLIHYEFFEANLALCAESQSLKKIKEVFRANKDRRNYFYNNNLNIAVHVRRPNQHDNRTDGPDVPDRVYIRAIELLRRNYSTQNPLFHIYSQGDIKNFKGSYAAADVVFHLNESIEDTFSSLVLADVLVTSASSFSYIAGILSEGAVYYIPFWHPPLPSWVVLER